MKAPSVFEVVWVKYRTEKEVFQIKQVEYYTAIKYYNYELNF